MANINIKRGDTFSLLGVYKIDGVASSVSSLVITSQVRDHSDRLVENLIVEKLVSTGQFLLKAIDTNLWSLNLLSCDIQFIEGDVIRSTSTFNILVEKDITR